VADSFDEFRQRGGRSRRVGRQPALRQAQSHRRRKQAFGVFAAPQQSAFAIDHDPRAGVDRAEHTFEFDVELVIRSALRPNTHCRLQPNLPDSRLRCQRHPAGQFELRTER